MQRLQCSRRYAIKIRLSTRILVVCKSGIPDEVNRLVLKTAMKWILSSGYCTLT